MAYCVSLFMTPGWIQDIAIITSTIYQFAGATTVPYIFLAKKVYIIKAKANGCRLSLAFSAGA